MQCSCDETSSFVLLTIIEFEKQQIYIFRVCVCTLVLQHLVRKLHIVLPSVGSVAEPYFSSLSEI